MNETTGITTDFDPTKEMKRITAVIKPFKLDEVKEALKKLGYAPFIATETKSYGREKGHTELYRGEEFVVDFLPKVQVDVYVPSEGVDAAKEAIKGAALTNKIGDGLIAVAPVDSVEFIGKGL